MLTELRRGMGYFPPGMMHPPVPPGAEGGPAAPGAVGVNGGAGAAQDGVSVAPAASASAKEIPIAPQVGSFDSNIYGLFWV